MEGGLRKEGRAHGTGFALQVLEQLAVQVQQEATQAFTPGGDMTQFSL